RGSRTGALRARIRRPGLDHAGHLDRAHASLPRGLQRPPARGPRRRRRGRGHHRGRIAADRARAARRCRRARRHQDAGTRADAAPAVPRAVPQIERRASPYAAAPITAAAGIVRIQAITMRFATFQRTRAAPREAPTPTIAPVMVWVVETGTPR